MSIGTGIGAAAVGCPCGCGAAEKAHCWKESDWEESSAARALRAENEHLRSVIAGLEQGNRELHQGIAKQKAANERLRAEIAIREDGVQQAKGDVEALRAVIVRANNALFDVQPDVDDAEHAIGCHADTVPAAYLRLAKGAAEAWSIVAAVVADMVEPKESA